jgi:hypothetical protein
VLINQQQLFVNFDQSVGAGHHSKRIMGQKDRDYFMELLYFYTAYHKHLKAANEYDMALPQIINVN